jgi:tRNA (mo5U34)-methyltransferase
LAGNTSGANRAWQRDQHGLFKQWSNAVEFLPELTPHRLDLLHSVTAESKEPLSEGQLKRIDTLMRNLMPWRKGPYSLYGVNIDTEWRSDWKWDRVLPHLSDLTGRTILDVGCGGYHMWRMIGAGAHLAVGIDPTQLFLCQFGGVNCWAMTSARICCRWVLNSFRRSTPLIPYSPWACFYHRRSPLEHLWQLKDQLVKDGELVLETLVVEGDENTVLVPGDRYAQMRNVYFIPSALALKNWLEKCGLLMCALPMSASPPPKSSAAPNG